MVGRQTHERSQIGSAGHGVAPQRQATRDRRYRLQSARVEYQQKKGGKLATEFFTGAWVNNVAWSPDATKLAAVCQDSTVRVMVPPNEEQRTCNYSGLPLTSVEWLDNRFIVAAGFDSQPVVFDSMSMTEVGKLTPGGKKKKKELTATQKARMKFLNQDSRGQAGPKTASKGRDNLQPDAAPILSIRKMGEYVFSSINQVGSIEFWNGTAKCVGDTCES